MRDYSFLLKYLQERDRILLYGMGRMGQDVYHFFQKMPNFKIVGFVDIRADGLSHEDVPVYLPEHLRTLSEDYDKLILTIWDQTVGFNVYRQLIDQYGVEENRVIVAFVYSGPFCQVSLETFAFSQETVGQEIQRFIENGYLNIQYFKPIISELRLQKNSVQNKRLKELVLSLPSERSIVLSYILYHAGNFEPEILKGILQAAIRVNDPKLTDFLYGIFVDTSYMPFARENLFFPEFYNMRRELLKKICVAYEFEDKASNSVISGKKKIKKICIITQILYDKESSPTLVRVQLANILSDLGYEVKIMPLDAMVIPDSVPLIQPIYLNGTPAKLYKAYHESVFRQKISIEYPEECCNIRNCMQERLDKIYEYSPDLILDMSDEMSVISYLYAQRFPTLYMLTRGYVSSSFFSYLMVRDVRSTDNQNEYYQHPIKQEQYFVIDTPFCSIPPAPKKTYSRSDFLCDSSDFIFITVGLRLGIELTEEMIGAVCQRVLTKPHMKWFVVGEKNNYLLERQKEYSDKIIYIPYEDDLPALYKICNAYLNPPRMGGGTSISWAMHYGLPVVMSTAPSDRTDLGSASNMFYNTFEEMAWYLTALQADPVFYAECKERSQRAAVGLAEKQRESWARIISDFEKKIQG